MDATKPISKACARMRKNRKRKTEVENIRERERDATKKRQRYWNDEIHRNRKLVEMRVRDFNVARRSESPVGMCLIERVKTAKCFNKLAIQLSTLEDTKIDDHAKAAHLHKQAWNWLLPDSNDMHKDNEFKDFDYLYKTSMAVG